MSAHETRAALEAAVIRVTATAGPRGVTARSVAEAAGVNQALVFYHFGGVDGLIREAYDRATRAMIDDYVDELSVAATISDLHAVGVRLAHRARTDGSGALLAQVIAAAYTDPEQARLLAASLHGWHTALADAVRRVLVASGLEEDLDVQETTAAIAAATIGMITVDGVAGAPLGDTLGSLGRLATAADRLLRILPRSVARRVLSR